MFRSTPLCSPPFLALLYLSSLLSLSPLCCCVQGRTSFYSDDDNNNFHEDFFLRFSPSIKRKFYLHKGKRRAREKLKCAQNILTLTSKLERKTLETCAEPTPYLTLKICFVVLLGPLLTISVSQTPEMAALLAHVGRLCH